MPPPRADSAAPLRVNRAPVLTLWAAVVAERLAHPEDAALTLGSAVAGTAARAKARRLGIAEDRPGEDGQRRPADAEAKTESVRLLGREIPVSRSDSGVLLAAHDGRPQSPAAVRNYLARAFGDRLGEVRAAMEALAASLPPDELDRTGFRLYERFRPEVPEGVEGWGAKAVLDIGRIRNAAR
ncbi:MAG: hypothetical protein ICV73_18255 [Acetobacteraceae bacterium]|nr:hypothetical protein [Acetobacteraceae bacterium]